MHPRSLWHGHMQLVQRTGHALQVQYLQHARGPSPTDLCKLARLQGTGEFIRPTHTHAGQCRLPVGGFDAAQGRHGEPGQHAIDFDHQNADSR